MRTVLLFALFSVALPASSAPNFPLTFVGENCYDPPYSRCEPLTWHIYQGGGYYNDYWYGEYTWNSATRQFTASDFYYCDTVYTGTYNPDTRCVQGTIDSPWCYQFRGRFYFCKS